MASPFKMPSFGGGLASFGFAPAAAPVPAPVDVTDDENGDATIKLKHAAEHTIKGLEVIHKLEDAMADHKDDTKSAADDSKSVKAGPPPIHITQRPLRRRIGPEWACVEVLCENEEKGPCESTVRCRFCGEEFLSDTSRIREHVQNLYQENKFLLDDYDPSRILAVDTGPAKDKDDATSISDRTEQEAAAAALGVAYEPGVSYISVESEPPPPPPPCEADIDPGAMDDRTTALQWFKDYDMLQFFNRVGIANTRDVAEARRRAEVAEARAILYPSREYATAAAAAAADAVQIVTRAGIAEWLASDKLRFVGCGLKDDDCLQLIELLQKSGALRELREFSLAQNAISDVGFEALCKNIVTPIHLLQNGDQLMTEAPPPEDDGSGASVDDELMEDDESNGMPRTGSRDDLESRGFLPSLLGNRLEEFSTFRNPIGDRSLAALAEALDKGGLPNLRALNISGTALVNPDGSPRVAAAAARDSVRRLREAVHVEDDDPDVDADKVEAALHDDHGVGDEGVKAFASLIQKNKPTPGKPGMLSQLTDLRLFGNSISDEGLIALSTALSERMYLCRNLESLWLQNNFIGDRGLCFMVDTLFNGGMVNLRRLLLAENCIASAGTESIATALAGGALKRLKKLSLFGNALEEKDINHLCNCLTERTHSLGGDSVVELDVIPTPPEVQDDRRREMRVSLERRPSMSGLAEPSLAETTTDRSRRRRSLMSGAGDAVFARHKSEKGLAPAHV